MKRFLILFMFVMFTFSVSTFSYTDVGDGEWYYDNVRQMSSLGYLNGYPDGSFCPEGIITNAEFVSVVARVNGLNSEAYLLDHWAGGQMMDAMNSGWFDYDEIPPSASSYDKPISRQLAVKVIMRAFAPEARGDYNSVSVNMKDFSTLSGRYYDSVIAAYSYGIVYGDNYGNFNPTSNLTRAEACAIISRAINILGVSQTEYIAPTALPTTTPMPIAISGGVSENGALQVIGTSLCNQNGQPIVLHGMSSHGVQWFPQFLTNTAISQTTAHGANVFRIAMYTAENGYIQNRELKKTVMDTVDVVNALDMYAIIDWHILSDSNPNMYKAEAKEFFAEMAVKYAKNPGVIYEICNEPNGGVSWSGDVKPYAEELIATIREYDTDAVILVGSPTWSQDLHEVAKNPILADNIMYTCHFYAGTHTAWLRDRITNVLGQGIPVFISEWGTSDASGSGGVFLDEAQIWIDYLASKNISWCNWSWCDKAESSAAIPPNSSISDGITYDELTPSGKFVFDNF